MIRLLPALVLLAAVVGCRDDVTEVVVVLESDLLVPADTDVLLVTINPGPVPPTGGSALIGTVEPIIGLSFPLSIGFTSQGTTTSFSITLQLQHAGTDPAHSTIVVSRTITDIRFVDQQTMMLVVPFLRACACMGTTCPSPGDPNCENIQTPVLKPFDPALAPPSTMMPPTAGL
jgi:hypothetical protein